MLVTYIRKILHLFPFLLGLTGVLAQEKSTPPDSLALSAYYDMSLEQLDSIRASGVSSELEKFINSLISVATQKSLSTRNTPSVVTLITEEEIKTSGARDLIDVLRLVPGFDFALDEEGRVGIGIRGNWANEGKVLLRIDGQEMNEIYTAKLFFGNHYPVDLIKRIEVIRGPGSAIYGGFAEFGVINIVTKGVNDLKGIQIGGTLGQMTGTYGRQNFQFYVGTKWKSKTISFSMFNGRGQRSNREAYGFYQNDSLINLYGVGAYSSLAGNSEINPSYSNFSFTYKKFSFRTIGDFYEVTDVNNIGGNKRRNIKYGLENSYTELSYQFKINDKLTITPKLNSIYQFPNTRGVSDSQQLENFKNGINRNRLNVTAFYDVTHRINFIGGAEVFADHAQANTTGRLQVGDRDVSYFNVAAFAQGIFNLPEVNITAGLRYDHNSAFGQAFVPRLGLTKKYNKFHFKFLLSGAFRAPSIGNVARSFNGDYTIFNNGKNDTIVLHPGIKPERTFVFEAEVGYQLSSKVFVTANIYDITIRQPIVYYFYQNDFIQQKYGFDAGINVYQNFDRTGTRGFELDFRLKDTWGYLNFNYSFYSLASKPRISAYAVSTFNFQPELREEVNRQQVLGFASHKLNVNWTYYLRKGFSANITATLYGPRYGYDVKVGTGKFDVDGQLIRKPISALGNLFFRHENLLKGFHLGAGIYNVFDAHFDFLQPYFGLNTPLPGPAREYVLKASYEFQFKKKKDRAEHKE